MKIKQTRQVNLHELNKWAWENKKTDVFKSMYDGNIAMRIAANVIYIRCADDHPNFDSLFEIEEEVEIDENTVIPRLLIVKSSNQSFNSTNKNVKDIQRRVSDVQLIYVQNDDGSIGDLIWKDGEMVE